MTENEKKESDLTGSPLDLARLLMQDDIQYELEGQIDGIDIILTDQEEKSLKNLPTSLLLKLYRHICEQECGAIDEDDYQCSVSLDPHTVCGIHGTKWKDPV